MALPGIYIHHIYPCSFPCSFLLNGTDRWVSTSFGFEGQCLLTLESAFQCLVVGGEYLGLMGRSSLLPWSVGCAGPTLPDKALVVTFYLYLGPSFISVSLIVNDKYGTQWMMALSLVFLLSIRNCHKIRVEIPTKATPFLGFLGSAFWNAVSGTQWALVLHPLGEVQMLK